jgi:hypothetical protein
MITYLDLNAHLAKSKLLLRQVIDDTVEIFDYRKQKFVTIRIISNAEVEHKEDDI